MPFTQGVRRSLVLIAYSGVILKLLSVFLLFLFSYLQYALWFQGGGASEAIALEQKIEDKRLEINRIQAGNRRLTAEVRDLEQGLDAVEERARSLIGMIKEDEMFFRVGTPDSFTRSKGVGFD